VGLTTRENLLAALANLECSLGAAQAESPVTVLVREFIGQDADGRWNVVVARERLELLPPLPRQLK
jgi:hypothetical protein